MKKGDVISVQYVCGLAGRARISAAEITGFFHDLIQVRLASGQEMTVVPRTIQSVHSRKSRSENFELLKDIHEYITVTKINLPMALHRRLTKAITEGK
jgi:hypothetical protein